MFEELLKRDFSCVKNMENCYKGGLTDFVFTLGNKDIKWKIYKLCESDHTQEPIVVLGGSASGKSFLAACIEKEVRIRGKRYMRVNQEALVYHLIECIKYKEYEKNLMKRYADYDVVVFDGIEEIKNKDFIQEIFAQIVWDLYTAGKSVILFGLLLDKGYSVLLKAFNQVFILQALPKLYRKIYIRRILLKAGLVLSRKDIRRMADKNMGIIVGGLNRLLISTIDEREKGRLYVKPERVKTVLGRSFYEK